MVQPLFKRNILIYGIIVFTIISCFGLSIFSTIEHYKKVKTLFNQVSNSEKIIISSKNVLIYAIDYESLARGYALKPDSSYITGLNEYRSKINNDLNTIKSLFADNQQQIDSLEQFINFRLRKSDSLILKVNAGLFHVEKNNFPHLSGKIMMDNIKKLSTEIEINVEKQLEIQKEEYSNSISHLYFSLIALILVITVFCAYFVVTTRKDIERQKLLNSQEKYINSIFNSGNFAMISTDEKFNVVNWNKGAENIYGYTLEEAKGKSATEMVGAQISEEERKLISEELLTNGYWRGEAIEKNKKGDIIHIFGALSTLKDKQGKTIGYSSINNDITELVDARSQITLLEKMTDATSDAIIIMNNDFIIDTWNKGALTLYGYTREEAINSSLIKLLQIHLNQNQIEKYKLLLAETEFWTGEIKQINKAGETLYVLSSITAIKKKNGVIDKYVIVNKNISEFKTQEQKLKEVNHKLEIALSEKSELLAEMYDRISDAFVSIDRDWKYTFVNKKAGEILARDPKELIGKTIWDEYPDAINFHFYKAFHEALTKKIHISFEDYFPHVDKWLENNIYPSERGINVYYRDTTSLRKSKEELMELNTQLRNFTAKLENAIEEERKFIAQEIHDQLGQQMTALKIDIVWIKKRLPDEQIEIKNKINNVVSMLEENISLIRKLSLSLRPSILDDLGLIAALDWQYKEFEKRCNITCTFTHDIIDEDLPSTIRNTIYRISQEALTNIMRHSNASKVSISLIQKDDTLLLMIIDNGVGFIVEEKTNHFGLLSMKERALSIKGDFRITSINGIGTTIKLIIRLHKNN